MVDLTLQHPMVASIKVSDRIFNGPSITVGFSMDDFLLMEEDMFKNSRYVDVTAQRSANINYTNNSGKTIFVSVVVRDSKTISPASLLVDGIVVSNCGDLLGPYETFLGTVTLTAIVPPGSIYLLNPGDNTIDRWVEARPVTDPVVPIKWKDLTAERQLGVEYTNNSGDYMDITVIFKLTNASQATGSGKILIDNIEISSQPLASTTPVTISTRIPPGSKYKVMAQYASYQWNELRS